jgi:hypothetical protein
MFDIKKEFYENYVKISEPTSIEFKGKIKTNLKNHRFPKFIFHFSKFHRPILMADLD